MKKCEFREIEKGIIVILQDCRLEDKEKKWCNVAEEEKAENKKEDA